MLKTLLQPILQKSVFVLALFTYIFVPIQVSAQSSNSCDTGIFPLIVICGRTASSPCAIDPDTNKDTTKMCKTADFIEILSRLILFAITLILLLLPLVFVWIGVELLIFQKTPDKILKLKSQIFNVLIGFFVIFAAWLIIKTIVSSFGVKSEIPNFLLNKDGSKADISSPR
jgi:hypothetical protein